MQFRRAWPRVRLRTRIAVTILSAIIAVAALSPCFPPYACTTPNDVQRALARREGGGSRISDISGGCASKGCSCRPVGSGQPFGDRWRRKWHEAKPESEKGLRPFVERARATIERDLEGKVRKVAVRGVFELRGNMFMSIQPTRRISYTGCRWGPGVRGREFPNSRNLRVSDPGARWKLDHN